MSIRDTHTATITLNVQQLFEVSKALTDRIAKYALAPEGDYPDRWQDIATLQSVQQVLDKHIEFVVDTYEAEIASEEAKALDDADEVRRFLDGE